jgi:hypothetical protein
VQRFYLALPPENSIEELLDPVCAFKALRTSVNRLKRNSELIVFAGNLRVELVVDQASEDYLALTLIHKTQRRGEPVDDMKGTGKYRRAWGGDAKLNCVVGPNGGTVRTGIRSREEAEADVRVRNQPTAVWS